MYLNTTISNHNQIYEIQKGIGRKPLDGVFLYLLFHILINLMGILALIPLTGVPLPFLSYGG